MNIFYRILSIKNESFGKQYKYSFEVLVFIRELCGGRYGKGTYISKMNEATQFFSQVLSISSLLLLKHVQLISDSKLLEITNDQYLIQFNAVLIIKKKVLSFLLSSIFHLFLFQEDASSPELHFWKPRAILWDLNSVRV